MSATEAPAAATQSEMIELCLLCRLQRRARDLKLPMSDALRAAAVEERALRDKLKCESDSRMCRLCNVETDVETLCSAIRQLTDTPCERKP